MSAALCSYVYMYAIAHPPTFIKAVVLAAGTRQGAKVPTTTKITFAEVSGGPSDSLPSTLAGRLGSLTLSHRLSMLSGTSGVQQKPGQGRRVQGLQDVNGKHLNKQLANLYSGPLSNMPQIMVVPSM
jgi:hypothetical protein